MKKVRYQAGGNAGWPAGSTGSRVGGDEIVTIPSGSQLTLVRVIPGVDVEIPANSGTWFSINEGGPVFLIASLCLDRHVFGYCCPPTESGIDECGPYTRAMNDECDRYPGDQSITIKIGLPARPANAGPDGPGPSGVPADEWEVFYIEGGGNVLRR